MQVPRFMPVQVTLCHVLKDLTVKVTSTLKGVSVPIGLFLWLSLKSPPCQQ